MVLDAKAQVMFSHYKCMIEERSFDEYDILGFLIFIRSYLGKKYKFIREFSDLIAHRPRNKGLVQGAIKAGIENFYQTKENSRSVIGYSGMSERDWSNEWEKLGKEFDIRIDVTTILEITMCVFSLAQFSEYKIKEGDQTEKKEKIGKIILFLHGSDKLSLQTTENSEYAPFVCFVGYGPYKHLTQFSHGYIDKAVETFRENGNLHLRIAGTDTIIV